METKYLKKIAKLAILIFFLSSCNYLDIVPPATPDFKDTMKDRDATLGFLYSCYAGVRELSGNWILRYYMSTDEFVEPALYQHDEQYMSYNQVTPSAHTGIGPWGSCYNNLGQCHLFIKYIDELKPDNVTEQDKVRWKAEIKFLEAFYHMELLNAYGPIPLINKYIQQDTPKTDFPGRSHYDVCVDSICKWFDDASVNLPATVPVEELGRATSTACKALKARVLLYAASPLWNGAFPFPNWKNPIYESGKNGKELVSKTYDQTKWTKALDACNDAIQLSTTDGKRQLFDIESSEILRNNDKLNLPTYIGADSTFRKKVMQMRYLMTSTEEEGNHEIIFGVLQGETNVISECIPHGVTLNSSGNPIGGWSGASPTLYSMEHFYTKDGKLPEKDENFYPKENWLESAGLSNTNIIKLNAYREPRFYAWLSFDGDEYGQLMNDGSPLIINVRSSDKKAQGYNPSLYQRDNSQTGFFIKKLVQPNMRYRKDGGNNMRLTPRPYLRLAELYLNRAECYANLGETQKALDDLNVIRRRAGIPELSTRDITPENDILQWVHQERYIELWGEGQRYYDLRRWLEAPEHLKAGTREGLNALQKADPSFAEFNQRTKINQPFQWANRMYLLPITNSELYSNPNLVQSPGY